LYRASSVRVVRARKNNVPFTLVSSAGLEPLNPGKISSIVVVVPSCFQSSSPLVPSVALKKIVPLTLTRSRGAEPFWPGAVFGLML
jgi:hypothetical protein